MKTFEQFLAEVNPSLVEGWMEKQAAKAAWDACEKEYKIKIESLKRTISEQREQLGELWGDNK